MPIELASARKLGALFVFVDRIKLTKLPKSPPFMPQNSNTEQTYPHQRDRAWLRNRDGADPSRANCKRRKTLELVVGLLVATVETEEPCGGVAYILRTRPVACVACRLIKGT